MEIRISETTTLDGFFITAFGLIALCVIGMFFLFSYSNEQQELGLAKIDKMGCGELKEYILNKGWNEFGARTSTIQANAEHQYTWMCEK